jgi:hypothetical protein
MIVLLKLRTGPKASVINLTNLGMLARYKNYSFLSPFVSFKVNEVYSEHSIFFVTYKLVQ